MRYKTYNIHYNSTIYNTKHTIYIQRVQYAIQNIHHTLKECNRHYITHKPHQKITICKTKNTINIKNTLYSYKINNLH